MSVEALLAEHGSPLWLADADRVRERLAGFRAVWGSAWPALDVAYSYKTNRNPAFLRAVDEEGAGAEVVCAAEYALARDVIGVHGAAITVNGPSKPAALLVRAADDDALVIVDSAAELERVAAAGVIRVGLRVALPGFGGPTRFGVAPDEVVPAGRRAAALGLTLEALSVHLVSTDFARPLDAERPLASCVEVTWPKPAAEHVGAARTLARLVVALRADGVDVATLDLGGGLPSATAHAGDVAEALHDEGFTGRLTLEPGRALVHDAVDLAMTVVAVKALADGRRCVVVDAGTNLLPGALWGWPRLEALAAGDPCPTLVSGPLCLNVDVLHPAADLPELGPGDVLVARGVGAYQQVHATQFGDPRPAVVTREDGAWRLTRRRETLADLLASELEPSTTVPHHEEPPWSA